MTEQPVIRPVETRADFKQFVTLPRKLYTGMPGFVAPLDAERYALFDRSAHPFFTHGEAAYWIAQLHGRPVGRISAQIDRLHERTGESDLGMFGAFDAIDDPQVTAALLSQALAWLRSRGKTRIRGPFNLSISSESGLLVEGFEEPAMVLMPWHPPYLARHIEAHGFSCARALLGFYLDRTDWNEDRIPKAMLNSPLSSRFTKRQFDPRRGLSEMLPLGEIYNRAWSTNWGFVPMTDEDIAGIYKAMRWFINSDSGVIIEENGKPVAFSITVGNVMDYVHDFDGRLTPLNLLRFAYRVMRHDFRSVRNVLFGIVPEYQGAATGAALTLALLKTYLAQMDRYKADRLELGWIEEGNRRTLGFVRYFGAKSSRRFHVFERMIGA